MSATASGKLQYYCIRFLGKLRGALYRRSVSIRQKQPPTQWRAFEAAREAFQEYAARMGSIEIVRVESISVGACDATSDDIIPITPDQIPLLNMWLKADSEVYNDAGVTLATNGQTVEQWNDQSGAGHDVDQTADPTRRPLFVTGVINGKPVVRFDATDIMLNLTADCTQPITYVALVKFTNGAGATNFITHLVGQDQVGRAAGGEAVIYGSGGPMLGGMLALDTYYILAATFSGPVSLIRINGATVATGDIGSAGQIGIVVGDQSPPGFTGDIVEIAKYGSALSITDIEGLEQYLRNKYGL